MNKPSAQFTEGEMKGDEMSEQVYFKPRRELLFPSSVHLVVFFYLFIV